MSHTHSTTHKRRPITSADLIRQAHAAAREKAGVRVKVRFPSALIDRARLCSADACDGLGDWVNKVCRQYRAGGFASVASRNKSELATREASECITVRAPLGMSAEDIKAAVACGCAYSEARRITYHPVVPARYLMEREV